MNPPTTPPLLQIVDWNEHFENAKSRTFSKCQYACVPNKHGVSGWSNVMGEVDGAAIYGIWQCLVQLCSRQQKPRDGWLTFDGKKDGRRLSARELSNLFRRPVDEIHRCIMVVTSPEVGFVAVRAGVLELSPGKHPTDTPVSYEYPSEDTAVSPEYPSSIPEPSSQVNHTPVSLEYPQPVSAPVQGMIDRMNEGDREISPKSEFIESPDEARELLGNLGAEIFKVKKRAAWPNDLDHHLVAALPMAREDLALIEWAYRLRESTPDHPVFVSDRQKTGLVLRASWTRLIENLASEPQKIRTARKSIGLNGLYADVEKKKEEPADWRELFAREYPTADLPASFWAMPKPQRDELPALRNKFADKAAQPA